MEKVRDYSKDIEIDPDNLEHELLTHPSSCLYYGDKLADAIYNRDQIKSNLRVTEAEIDTEIQKNWSSRWERFPSEAIRNGVIILDDRYKKALAILQKAEYNVNLLRSAKEAFDARGYAIGQLVTIFVAGLQSKKNKVQRRNEEIKRSKIVLNKPIGKRV